MSRRDNNGTNKSNIQSQGLNHHVETAEFDAIGQHVKKSKRGAADRRLRRYYPIVRLLPNVFALACLPLGSI